MTLRSFLRERGRYFWYPLSVCLVVWDDDKRIVYLLEIWYFHEGKIWVVRFYEILWECWGNGIRWQLGHNFLFKCRCKLFFPIDLLCWSFCRPFFSWGIEDIYRNSERDDVFYKDRKMFWGWYIQVLLKGSLLFRYFPKYLFPCKDMG